MPAAKKNRTQSSIDGLSHVDCIDLVVRKGTLVPGVEEIATSWRRCLTAHHLDPEIKAAPHIITEKEIKDSREPLRNVILHAQEELDRLYAIVGPQQYVVLLCNRDGVAIHHRGNESLADTYKDRGIWLGAVVSEQMEGTNGIGTCITDQRATMVHRDQHFRTRHIDLSCAGAPIFDPLGRLAGVLDTSSMNPQTTEQSLSLAMAATKLSARGIEERIFREYFRHAWNIAAAPCGGSEVAVLLAVDNDHRILGADHIARRIFGLTDEVLNQGTALATIFEYDSSIFRCKRMQDVAARLLRTGTDEAWNALITPPACGMSGLCSPTEALLHSRPRVGMLAHLPLPADPPTTRGGLAPARANRVCEYHGIVRDFDWPKWLPRAVRIFRNPSLLRKARMKTCLKLLTLHIRRDRFCDGHLGAMLASGHITAIIRRMDTFVQNSTPNLAIYSLAGPRICDRGHMIRRHNSHQSRGRLPSGF